MMVPGIANLKGKEKSSLRPQSFGLWTRPQIESNEGQEQCLVLRFEQSAQLNVWAAKAIGGVAAGS